MSEHRYMFTVRQQFGQVPELDAFYEVKSPDGITAEEADTWRTLNPEWCKDEIHEDSQTYRNLGMRLRFNSDMWQKVCLVRTEMELDRDTLDAVIKSKHELGELEKFLKESSI